MENKKSNTMAIAIAGTLIIAVILILSTVWMGNAAKEDNDEAVKTVSLLYLDELAGRREQVVENNLKNRIRDLQVAIGMMEADDLSDNQHLQAYQARMKRLYNLEKFAFVDNHGRIYTSMGNQDNIREYSFDYKTISAPEISIFNIATDDKKVVIAVPVDMPFMGVQFKVGFMEIDMDEMLSGISMDSSPNDATFCNIYTRNGVALSDTILGGLAQEDNLLEAMSHAQFDKGYSYEEFMHAFVNGEAGVASFTYDGIKETLSYEIGRAHV